MLLDQVRARNAFGFVSQLPPGSRSDFLQLARKLPAMFQTNGLLASWAHLLARDHAATAEAFLIHFRDNDVHLLTDETRNAERVLLDIWVASPGTRDLQHLTAEAVVFASWLKRAAEAICDTGENPAPGDRT